MKETKAGKMKTKKSRNSRNNFNCSCSNNSTKLLVPRNGTNVKESKKVEKRGNLLYNIIM